MYTCICIFHTLIYTYIFVGIDDSSIEGRQLLSIYIFIYTYGYVYLYASLFQLYILIQVFLNVCILRYG
jgi:hypothetical protein